MGSDDRDKRDRGGRDRSRDRKEKKKKRSASSESAERSREREKRRRKQQQEHVNKNRAPGAVPGVPAAPGGQRMFWDGFQWVPRAETNVNPNDPNVSRKLRRLYLGNLPYHLGVTEDSFSKQLYDSMKERGMCNDPNQNPVLHVWFARDKGANYGFCEVASIEETERALQLDGMLVLGVPISIKRPTDATSPAGSIGGMQQGGPAAGTGMLALQGMQVQATSNIIHIEEILKVDSKTTKDDFDDVKEDMQEGCGAHGRVDKVFIIRPEHNQRQPAVRAGDVFLRCASVDDATKIIRAMGHRKYDGRQINMKSYSDDDYSRLIKPLM
eukprot:TRINITY_DN2191_c0_g1_i1.p1 TRINITY_DN2191_c0_g1~~TRINITY_DN2191_c0_g1_i1.p1  ORF type:complete len:326 (-),score=97.89 TRINITY_DN2191_c0_g1_i1:183-1160(-)